MDTTRLVGAGELVGLWPAGASRHHLKRPIERPHSYPWSTVLRVPTGEGVVYFKAVSPMHPYEPALIAALASWSPERVPRLLSVDTERGWLLMRGAGRRLREARRPGRDMGPWLPVLPSYAELQIELSPRVAGLCEQLAEYHIPETLNHGDLTDGNVFVGEEGPVFIDWGDGCVSHPFYSLRTVLVSAEISLGLEENSPELHPLRDAYLQPWERYGSHAELLEALDLSSRLASINGALTWHRLVSSLSGALREVYAEPVPALLKEFLDAETTSPG